jgi:RNA polymerase sigma factor (sigma-70 family)
MTTSNRTLTPDRRDLASDWFGYAVSLVRRLRRRFPEVPTEEFVSAAVDGLMVAAAKWDPARGVPFGPYLAFVVLRRGLRTVENYYRRSSAVPLSVTANEEGEPIEPVDYRTGDPARMAAGYDLTAHVCRALPAREAEVLWLLYAEERTQAEVGERFGVTRQRVAQLQRQALRTARLAVAVAGVDQLQIA